MSSSLVCAIVAGTFLAREEAAWAQDKSGARDGLVRVPSAGATVNADGSTFLSQGNTGAADYALPLPELPGRAGVAPSLTLTYSPMSGDPASGFGSGWRLDVPSIEITYDYGIPWPGGVTDNQNTYRLRGERLLPAVPGTAADPTQPVPYYLQATEQAIIVRYHASPFEVSWGNPVPSSNGGAAAPPSIPSGFEVVYPDGKVELYTGDLSQAEGTVLISGVPLVTRFPLAYEVYRPGEWVKYSYVKAGGNTYLREVAFAGGLSKYTFDLSPSASNVHTYVYGYRQSNGLLVERLTASYAGETRNRWCFAYSGPSATAGGVTTAPECLASATEARAASTDDAPVYDRLVSVLRYGNTENVAPASVHEPRVDFEYSSLSTPTLASRALVYSAPGFTGPLQKTNISGLEIIDVNNDSVPDLVQAPSVVSPLPTVYYGKQDLTRSFATQAPLVLSRPGRRQVALNLTLDNFQVADINGDGFEDIVEFDLDTMHVYGGGPSNPPGQPYVWRADYALGGAFDATWFANGGAQWVDLNQDGLTDILTTTSSPTGQQWTVFMNQTQPDWSIGFTRIDLRLPLDITESKFLVNYKKYDIVDVNGDTLPDFTWTNAPQGWMCVYENTGVFYGQRMPTTLLFGDPNLQDPDCGNGVKVSLVIPTAARAYDTWMLDVNGDGILDVVTLGTTFHQIHIWYGLGNLQFSDALDPNGVELNSAIDPEAARSRTVDITGDGHDDIVVFQSVNGIAGAVIVNFYHTTNQELVKPGLLTAVEIETGARLDIRYGTSTAETTRDLNAGLQAPLMHFPIIVKKQTARSIGAPGRPRSNVEVVDYAYHNPYYDPVTRDFRGFGTIDALLHGDEGSSTPTQESTLIEETFLAGDADPTRRLLSGRRLSKRVYKAQTDASLLARLHASDTFDPTDVTLHSLSTATQTERLVQAGPLLEETANAWTSIEQVAGSGAYFAWLASSSTTEHDAGASTVKSTTRTFQRDALNVLTQELEDTTWTGVPYSFSPAEYVKTTTFTYDQARTTLERFGAISLPDLETTTVRLGATGTNVEIRKVATEYDPEKGLVTGTHTTVHANAVPDAVLTEAAGSNATLLASLRALSVSARDELVKYGLDSYGNVASRSDGLGLVEQVTYDASGVLPIEYRRANLENRALDQTTALTYRADGRLQSSTSPLGLTSQFTYDDLGRRTARLDGDGGGETYRYRYGAGGLPNLVLTTTRRYRSGQAPAGETETVERLSAYRVDGRPLAEVEDAEGGVRVLDFASYNRKGNRSFSFGPYVASRFGGTTSITAADLFALGDVPTPAGADGAGQVPTAFQFDLLDRVTSRQLPNGRQQAIDHEPWGRLVTETYATPSGAKSRQTYEISTPQGVIGKVEVGDGQQVVTHFARDEAGHLTSIQLDGEPTPRNFKYDSAGRQEYRAVPGAGEVYTLLDARERAVAQIHVPESGPAMLVESVYDSLDRLTERYENGEPVQQYLYDRHQATYHPSALVESEVAQPIGQLTVARSFDSNHLHDYEEELGYTIRGDLAVREAQLGRTFQETFGHTLNGAQRTVVTPRGLEADLSLNRADQVSGVSVAGASFAQSTPIITEVSYADNGQVGRCSYRLGAQTAIAYDPRSLAVQRVDSSFVAKDGSVQPLQALIYDTDGADDVVAIRDVIAASTFGSIDRSGAFEYDWRGELTKSTIFQRTASYAYGKTGAFTANPDLPGTWMADPRTALVPVGTDANPFSYDGFGRLAKSPEIESARFDGAGRLVSAQLKTGQTIRYGYSADGRLTYKSVSATDGTTAESLYPVTSYEEEAGGAARSYVFLGEKRLVRFEHGRAGEADRWFYYLQDPVGSADLLIGEDGSPVEQNLYEPYGSEIDARTLSAAWSAYVTANAPLLPAEATRDRFAGRHLDSDTGLYDFGGRYYHPKLGRFVSPDARFLQDPERCQEDTLGCALYGYTGNDPLKPAGPALRRAPSRALELAQAAGYVGTPSGAGLLPRALTDAEIASVRSGRPTRTPAGPRSAVDTTALQNRRGLQSAFE